MRILYFAEIKEIIGKGEDIINIQNETSLDDLIENLKSINEKYRLAFKKKNLKCAVNYEFIDSFEKKINDSIHHFELYTLLLYLLPNVYIYRLHFSIATPYHFCRSFVTRYGLHRGIVFLL